MKRKSAFLLIAVLFIVHPLFFAQAADKTPQDLIMEAKAAIKEISVDSVKQKIDAKNGIVILDVRDGDEFEQEHIPGAINISRGQLEFQVQMMIPDKSKAIIVYCGMDRRSPLATRTLNELGYINAVNMTGGLQAWKAAGYPLTK